MQRQEIADQRFRTDESESNKLLEYCSLASCRLGVTEKDGRGEVTHDPASKREAYKSQHSSVPSSEFIKLKGAKAITKGKRHCHSLATRVCIIRLLHKLINKTD